MAETFLERFKIKVIPYLKDSSNYKSILLLLFDIAYHRIIYKTNPVDYLRFEFYKNDKSPSEKKRYISKLGSIYYPWEGNPVSLITMFDNKLIFKTMLKGYNIPQAELLATIGSEYEIKTNQQFVDWLKTVNQDILIKPIYGSGGENVHLLTHKNNNFYENGNLVNHDLLWKNLFSDVHNGYIAEERLVNIDTISKFNKNCFHTLRVVTIKTNDGDWNVTMVALRIGKKGSCVDNLSAGATFVKFDEQGKGICAFDVSKKIHVEKHYDTKENLIGFQIPHFNEVKKFTLMASEQFPFMGAIGWDIGLTLDGIKVIEANPYFDAWYWQLGQLGPMLSEEIAEKLNKRQVFSRWDRSFVSPLTRKNPIRA